jgi:hypothetical protein
MTGAVNMTGVEPETSRSEATPVNMTARKVSDVLTTTTGRHLVALKEEPAHPERLDVERLCKHLADRIEANGSKRPVIGKKWRDAARRMIDIDGRSEEQIRAAIDWCQKDEFWLINIRSMPKLRDQYDRLRQEATFRQKKTQTRNGRQPTSEEFSDIRALARQLDAQEGNR